MKPTVCFRFCWACLLPLLVLCACQINVFSPLKPADTPGFGPNGEPRILSLTIPGIPSENIKIDQEARQITVTIPTNYSAQTITPTLRLTPNTTLVQAPDSRSTLWLLDGGTPAWARLRIQGADAASKNVYQVVYVPAGPLQFGQLSTPVSLTVDPFSSLYCLPLYNFVDGERGGILTLTHQQTGAQLTFRQEPSFWVNCDRKNTTDGSVSLSFIIEGLQPYAPGEYSAVFLKANGRSATLNQPIRLVRGEPRFFIMSEFSVAPVSRLDGVGANLFTTDQLNMLIYKAETSVQSVPVSLSLNQNQTLAQVQGVPIRGAGYYYTQLVLNGSKQANVQRLAVRATQRQVAIQSITPSGSSDDLLQITGPTVSLDAPVVLRRDRQYSINAGPRWGFLGSEVWRLRHRFTSIDNSIDEFIVAGTLQSFNMSIPATAKPGFYHLTTEGIVDGQHLLNGLTLDRVVQIQ